MGSLACTIIFSGELGARFGEDFQELTLSTADGGSQLCGQVRDQAELQGVLRQLFDLGLDVVSLTTSPVRDSR